MQTDRRDRVITIVILIILATVTINTVFGDNGLINQAQQAKDYSSNSTETEYEGLNRVYAEYANIMAEDSEMPIPEVPYLDETLVSPPNVTEGMTPVKWNEEKEAWEKTSISDENWYNYSETEKKWANVVLDDSTFNEDGTLNENEPYSMLVWIPRYAYKVTSGWHSNETGTVEIIFIDENNQDRDGKEYSGTYDSNTGTYSDYVVHPAFNYGDYNENKLTGFWVGKFESSNTNCTQDIATGEADYTGNEQLMIKANVTSWRNITVSNMFITCINLNSSNNIYGLNSNDNVVDPHLIKNSEWGAIAFLSKSKYGKGEEEVYINNNSNYITGIAGDTANSTGSTSIENTCETANGQKASTTGNIYGIYDMAGGAFETVAAYVNNSFIQDTNSEQYKNGEEIINSSKRYKEVYNVAEEDSRDNNYLENANVYGDAIYETSSSGNSGFNSWFEGYSYSPSTNTPFYVRGGGYNIGASTSIFAFSPTAGANGKNGAIRLTIAVL